MRHTALSLAMARRGQLARSGLMRARAGQYGAAMYADTAACPPIPLADRLAHPVYSVMRDCKPYGAGEECRFFPLDFDSATVAPAGVPVGVPTTIPANPQEGFIGKDLVIPSFLAPAFLIQINVGNKPQTLQPGTFTSAVAYSEASQRTRLALDPAGPGKLYAIVVINIGAAPARFLATIFGDTVNTP